MAKAIVSNVSKFPIQLTAEDGDSCMVPVGKNIPVDSKFLANVLPGIVVVQKPTTRSTAVQPTSDKKGKKRKS